MFQVFDALKSQGSHLNPVLYATERWWRINFVGEAATDCGGPFRDSLSSISDEICSTKTPLFIPVPNAKEEYAKGWHRDSWIPNPSCSRFDVYAGSAIWWFHTTV